MIINGVESFIVSAEKKVSQKGKAYGAVSFIDDGRVARGLCDVEMVDKIKPYKPCIIDLKLDLTYNNKEILAYEAVEA